MKDINKIIDSLSPVEQNLMYNALQKKLNRGPEYTISYDKSGYYVKCDSPWAKLVIGMLTSKVQEDKVDVELPDIDALIKENTSDEFIERKINDILGIKEK